MTFPVRFASHFLGFVLLSVTCSALSHHPTYAGILTFYYLLVSLFGSASRQPSNLLHARVPADDFLVMRLLRLDDDGWFDQTEFTGNGIPPYAILSHTWGGDWEEITFEDIRTRLGKSKAGYNKLQFCAEQAAKDGLKYFWVDTCCIDKSSSTELSEAINSMFRWYRDATRCYAFLADVSVVHPEGHEVELSTQPDWTIAFRKSKWFTRGWTLQELLAPESVEFFSANGQRLGDKLSLCQDILAATGIPSEALIGGFASLSQFSVTERLSWAAGRETKREEDAAYSLLGLFDLAMPLIYGEGREKAFRRLHRERETASLYEKLMTEKDIGNDSEVAPSVGSMKKAVLKRTASQAFDDDSNVAPQESEASEEDTIERQTELMQMWWDEAVADHMDPPDEYHKVAVLLLKWKDTLDELGVWKEVSDLIRKWTACQCVFELQSGLLSIVQGDADNEVDS